MVYDERCPIWGTPAAHLKTSTNGYSFESPRAGGAYFIEAVANAASLIQPSTEPGVKVRLTDWLVEQRRLGVATPEVTSAVLKTVESNREKSVPERADNLLRYLAQRKDKIGELLSFRERDNSKLEVEFRQLLAWTSSQEVRELIALADYCKDLGWVSHEVPPSVSDPKHRVALKALGYQRLLELGGTARSSTKAFVAMWFGPVVADAYTNGIEPGIRDAGYEPVRIDQKHHINRIDDEIIAEIRRARFVVADFTSEPDKSRGGVYYEAGFAHGLNVPVIMTVRKDMIKAIHFDTRQFNHIDWSDPAELRKRLKDRISAVIGDGPLRRQ